MGILNVTSDSFSDGGDNLQSPVKGALQLLEDGADIVDIGGQSTRPNAERIPVTLELERVIPVVKQLSQLRENVIISVDTFNYQVAQAAIEHGATIINDVSAGEIDSQMYQLLAQNSHVKYIMVHSRGVGVDMRSEEYGKYVERTVSTELLQLVDRAISSGVNPQQIVLDFGIGFSKAEGKLNWPIIANLHQLNQLGFPVLIAASRKRFLAELGGEHPKDRDVETTAISLLSAMQNVWGVRVHNVHDTVQALKVLDCVNNYRRQSEGKKIQNLPVNLMESDCNQTVTLEHELRQVKVKLSGISAYGKHGVNADEYIYPQPFVVDVSYTLQVPTAVNCDDIKNTVSYSAVGKAVVASIHGEHCDLIETLLKRIESAVKAVDSRIETVEVVLHKPKAPLNFSFDDVTVQFVT